MNNKRVKLPGFIIWLCQNGQLDEAFLLLRGADEEALKNKELGAEATARLEEMYGPYRDSFGETEPPTFKSALSQLFEVWNRLTAPAGEPNVTAADSDSDVDGGEDEEPEMNAEAKAMLQEQILMIIDHHNEVVKALRSKSVKFDAIGVQWVLSVLFKLLDVGALLSGMARKYGLSAECVHGAGNILVDWDEVYKDERLVNRFFKSANLSEEELAEMLAEVNGDAAGDEDEESEESDD